jgi:4'-phosphopantetheinyl transferase
MHTVIEDSCVHIWQANLKSLKEFPKDMSESLSPNELERASKLKFTNDRDHFIVRHYLLRLILSKYCDCKPQELMFSYNSYHKPFINIPEFREIKFNMSSSDDSLIIGLSNQNDIGIDVEKVRETDNLERIALENFSQGELDYLNSEKDKTTAFYNIWTRKEAFIKAFGKGIYFPLKSFCVDINVAGSCENLTIFKNPGESKLWRTMSLKTFDNHIAALAIKSGRFNVLYFQL